MKDQILNGLRYVLKRFKEPSSIIGILYMIHAAGGDATIIGAYATTISVLLGGLAFMIPDKGDKTGGDNSAN